LKTYENFITDFFKKNPKIENIQLVEELNDVFYDTFLPCFKKTTKPVSIEPLVKHEGNIIARTHFDTSIFLSKIESHHNKIFIVFSQFFLPYTYGSLKFFYDKLKELTERTTEPDTTFLLSIEKTRELIDFLEMRDDMNKYNL